MYGSWLFISNEEKKHKRQFFRSMLLSNTHDVRVWNIINALHEIAINCIDIRRGTQTNLIDFFGRKINVCQLVNPHDDQSFAI